MNSRPFGVTLLAILAAIAAVFAGLRTLQFLGLLPFTIDLFFGEVGEVSFRTFNFWYALLWGLLTWIYVWLVRMLWNVRPEGWLFLAVITVFNLILNLMGVIGGASPEDLAASFVLNALILIYVMLPGTKRAFDMESKKAEGGSPAPPPPTGQG